MNKTMMTVCALTIALTHATTLAATKKKANPEAALIARGQAEAKALLKDPESARFRNVHIGIDILGNKKVCGEINAKNAFGGYTGFTPFVFHGRAAILSGTPQDQLDYFSIAGGC